MATGPNHHVNARTATQNFPHRQVDNSTVENGVRLRLKVPIPLTAKISGPLLRIHDLRKVVGASRFNKERTNRGIFGESTRDY